MYVHGDRDPALFLNVFCCYWNTQTSVFMPHHTVFEILRQSLRSLLLPCFRSFIRQFFTNFACRVLAAMFSRRLSSISDLMCDLGRGTCSHYSFDSSISCFRCLFAKRACKLLPLCLALFFPATVIHIHRVLLQSTVTACL